MKILFVGDIFGRPGRQAVKRLVPELRREFDAEFVIANCENSAGGKGVTEKIGKQLFACGCDALTSGNHIYAQRQSYGYIEEESRLLRPANYPPGAPGRGYGVYESAGGAPVAVINACGRTFMGPHFDDPFRSIDQILAKIKGETSVIILDFHAETTSEKIAMGWYLDGRVSAVLGTHTHVQTADERLLHRGTAYITDTGMTGPYDSVIGDDKDIILSSILTQRPHRFEVAPAKEIVLCGVLLSINPETGRADSITRVRREFEDHSDGNDQE